VAVWTACVICFSCVMKTLSERSFRSILVYKEDFAALDGILETADFFKDIFSPQWVGLIFSDRGDLANF
jgi:hypothetical protein